MPESPKVETTRRGIARYVGGRRMARIDLYDSPLRWPVPAELAFYCVVLLPVLPARKRRRRACHGTAGADAKAAQAP